MKIPLVANVVELPQVQNFSSIYYDPSVMFSVVPSSTFSISSTSNPLFRSSAVTCLQGAVLTVYATTGKSCFSSWLENWSRFLVYMYVYRSQLLVLLTPWRTRWFHDGVVRIEREYNHVFLWNISILQNGSCFDSEYIKFAFCRASGFTLWFKLSDCIVLWILADCVILKREDYARFRLFYLSIGNYE